MSLKRCFYRVMVIAMLLPMAACATTPQSMEKPAMNLTGIWRGEIRVIPCAGGMLTTDTGRCNAVNRITFNLRQNDASLEGAYACAIGTMVCRSANTTTYGTLIGGYVSGRNVTIRVMLPGDLSSCLYNGFEQSPGQLRGSYRCYQGGGLIEFGQWQISRGEAESPSTPRLPDRGSIQP